MTETHHHEHEAPVHDQTAVPVTIVGQPAQANPGAHQGTHFTMVVSTGATAVAQLAPRDYERVEIRILAVDEPVVLAQSKEMAESASNTATGVPNPVGSYLPVGIDRLIGNCDEIWVAATSATAGRVSCIISRRLTDVHDAPVH
jgi:hypothetical protein